MGVAKPDVPFTHYMLGQDRISRDSASSSTALVGVPRGTQRNRSGLSIGRLDVGRETADLLPAPAAKHEVDRSRDRQRDHCCPGGLLLFFRRGPPPDVAPR